MHWLTFAFLCALALQLAARFWLSRRQIAFVMAHRNEVPSAFAGVVPLADHARAASYTAAKQRLALFDSVLGAALLLWLTLGGGIDTVGHWIARSGVTGWLKETLHVLGVFALLGAAGLPLSAYRTFGLEQRFGFNRTTVRTFVLDILKAWTLAALLGGPVVALVLWIMDSAGRRWWLVAWAAWSGVSLLLMVAWPRFIAPLFNRFSPLEDASLAWPDRSSPRTLRLLGGASLRNRRITTFIAWQRLFHWARARKARCLLRHIALHLVSRSDRIRTGA